MADWIGSAMDKLVDSTDRLTTPQEDVVTRLKRQNPAIAGYDWSIIDSRLKGMNDGRQLEFYAPNEVDNPSPGKPTVELFNPDLKDKWLDNAILGDMLHHLPSVDPQWAQMRNQFRQTLTPEQLAVDQRAYAEEKDARPFNDWMDQSRLDAYLRGFITPDEQNNWQGVYSPGQVKILNQMRQYLQTPKVTP